MFLVLVQGTSQLSFICPPSLGFNSLQVAGPYAYTPQVAPKGQIPEVPDCTVVPISGPGQPPAPDGI